jgi:hypothetical protein
MPDFLDADCVISSLVNQGVLVSKNWHIPKATDIYNVIFDLVDSSRAAGFAVFMATFNHAINGTGLKENIIKSLKPLFFIQLLCWLTGSRKHAYYRAAAYPS